MNFETTGRIIVELPPTMGVTRTGKDWERRDFILETLEQHPKKIRFSMLSFDGSIEGAPRIEDRVRVRFIIEARENNGNWYNDVKAYQVEVINQ